jgi:Luciferase-like monooxygenase
MRTGIAIPTPGPGTTAGHIVAWARAAEERGFDSLVVAGRVVHDSYEPLVAMSLVAAVTRRAELITHVEAAPLRHRGVLARQAASLGRASGGRLTVGVGLADTCQGLLERSRVLGEHVEELGGRRTLVTGAAELAARVLTVRGEGWLMAAGTPEDFALGYLTVHHAWTGVGRPGRPRGMALIDTDDDLDALRDRLDAFERAGADDVLLRTTSHDLAQLDRIANAALRVPALA